MPTADRYARYRADQTTIWVSKPAAAFLTRERTAPSEGVAAVLDRLLTELRKLRRGGGAAAGATSGARAKTPRAGAAREATRGAASRTRTTSRTGTATSATRRR